MCLLTHNHAYVPSPSAPHSITLTSRSITFSTRNSPIPIWHIQYFRHRYRRLLQSDIPPRVTNHHRRLVVCTNIIYLGIIAVARDFGGAGRVITTLSDPVVGAKHFSLSRQLAFFPFSHTHTQPD